MLTKLFLLPLLLHVLLTFVIGLRTFRARVKALKSGQAKMDQIATDSTAYPRNARLLANNFNNQFESPTLWYGASAIAVALSVVDPVLTALSWMFLMTRLAHSTIHAGNNDVPARARVYLFGFGILVLMWLWLAAKVAVTPLP